MHGNRLDKSFLKLPAIPACEDVFQSHLEEILELSSELKNCALMNCCLMFYWQMWPASSEEVPTSVTHQLMEVGDLFNNYGCHDITAYSRCLADCNYTRSHWCFVAEVLFPLILALLFFFLLQWRVQYIEDVSKSLWKYKHKNNAENKVLNWRLQIRETEKAKSLYQYQVV